MKPQIDSESSIQITFGRQIIVWCLIFSCLSVLSTTLKAQAASRTRATSTQQSQQLLTVGTARQDSAYRYLAEKGADLFRDGRFVEAEKYYRAALSNAEQQGVHDRRLAMLVTNLATDLRMQQRYEEAEPLFERAVEIERRTAAKDDELMVYTAKQYAALLRETARDASSEAIMASAHNGFAMVPVIKTIRTKDELETDIDAPDAVLSSVTSANGDRHKHLAPYVVIMQSPSPEPTPTFSPIPRPELSVTAELKMLADIERSYQNQSAQSMQMLPSRFSYINSGPLYSTPGLGGMYAGGGGGLVGNAPSYAHGHRVSGHRL